LSKSQKSGDEDDDGGCSLKLLRTLKVGSGDGTECGDNSATTFMGTGVTSCETGESIGVGVSGGGT
jgi:hypothetical protein